MVEKTKLSLDLPKDLKKAYEQMMGQDLALKDRLATALNLLQEIKYVSKEKPFELKIVLGKGKGGVVSKLDNVRLSILLEFLQDVFVNFVAPKFATGALLFDGLLSRNECIHSLTLIVAICYTKLSTQLQTTFDRDEKKSQFQDVTTLLTYIWQDPHYKVPLAVVELVLLETENILKDYQDLELSRLTNLQGPVLSSGQLGLTNTLILSALAQCHCILKSFDQEPIVHSQVKILNIIHQMARKLNYQMLVELRDFSDRTMTPQGFVFLNLLEEMHLGSSYTESCILNVLLIVTHKLVMRVNNARMTFPQLLTELVDKVESKLLAFMDEITQRQIYCYQAFLVSQNVQEITDCKPVVLDAQWITDFKLESDLNLDMSSTSLQNNWLRINRSLHNLAADVMPRFYIKKDNSLQMGSLNSFISHHCDLLRVQIHMIMKFELSQPFLVQYVKRLSVIPEHLGYDCKLVQTLQTMFSIFFKQNFNPDFNKEILRQIYGTFKLICAGAFNQVDRLQYLKVLFLLFMAVKLEGLDVCVVLSDKEQSLFATLLQDLFKADYYSDKYLRFFEEIYDLDSLPDVLNLQTITGELEQKSNDRGGVLFVNKVLQQHLSITVLVQIASRSESFFKLVLENVVREIDTNGMQQCDKGGTSYVQRVQTFADPLSEQSFSTVEYEMPQLGVFNSQLFQCLKLCLALFFNNNRPRTYYDILLLSETHFETHHNKTGALCSDCLKQDIKQQTLMNKAVQQEHMIKLFELLLKRIKSLSISFEAQELSQQQILSSDTLKHLLTLENQVVRVKLNQLRSQNQDRLMSSNKRYENATFGFKIVEKVCTMMMRFLVFCSQDPTLAVALVEATVSKRNSSVFLQSIPNVEFRMLMLRNLIFWETNPKIISSLSEYLSQTLQQITKSFSDFKEQANKFELLKLKLNSGQSDNPSTFRVRSNSGQTQVDYELMFQNMRLKFRKLAEVAVSILSLYPKLHAKEDSLQLLENSEFQKTVLKQIQIYVTDERSALAILIEASLATFLFKSKEQTNPLRYDSRSSVSLQTANNSSFANKMCLVYERHFDFLLSTVKDYINVVSPEPSLFDTVIPDPQDIQKLLQTIKIVAESLNEATVVQTGDTVHEKVTADLLKLRCAITTSSFTYLKKILVFVAEQEDESVDCHHIISQLSQMLVRVFNVPKAAQLKDYFGFMREIVYYNTKMDHVDVRLLEQVLSTWISSMQLKQRSQMAVNKQTKWNAQLDHFVFSKLTPGLLLLNSLECQKELQIVVMFRFSQNDMLAQKKHNMVILSIQDRSDETAHIASNQERLGFEVELVIDVQNKSFVVQETRKSNIDSVPFKPIPIQNKWYTLVVKLNRFSRRILEAANQVAVELYIDKICPESRVVYGDFKSDHRAKFYLALGNSVDYCLGDAQSSKMFQGRCSIPMFCVGIPDCKSIEPEPSRILIAQLQEMINSKQMLNVKTLDLEWVNKKLKITDFHSVDHFISKAIIAHQVVNQLGFLAAVHHRKTSEVMVGIGGFENMFPLVKQILNSNLLSLGREIPGRLFCKIFKILGSFLALEPAHMESLFFRRNLIDILKFWIIKVSTRHMMTSELLQEIQNILRKCVFTQVMQIAQDQQSVFANLDISIQNYKPFYSAFLQEYVHQILLDPSLLALNCYINSKENLQSNITPTLIFNEQVSFIHKIFCPSLKPQLYEQRESASDITSSHSDPTVHPRTLTNYLQLRDTVIKFETVPKLMELVIKAPFCTIQNLPLLNQLGDAISACILHLDDRESFHKIVRLTFQESQALQKETLLAYLRVVLLVITDESFRKKKNLVKVFESRDFASEKLAISLAQFETPLARSMLSNEVLALQDAIISVTLQVLVQIYVNRRTKLRTIPLSDRVAAVDESKRQLIKIIQDSLQRNACLLTETYLTLMLVAFGKTKIEIISVDALIRQIHQCVVWLEQRGSHEVHDFDIDFFFLSLSLLNKYPSQTQVLILQNLLLFLQHHHDQFMQVFQAQSDEVGLNPFNERLKEFYFKVALLLLENVDAQTSALAQHLLVDVCYYQFTRSNDELKNAELTERDDWGLWLFRRIHHFLEPQLSTQYKTLQRILKRIVDEINQRGRLLKQFEQVKLNLKLLHLLQFIEELYVAKRNSLSSTPYFQDTLLALMFLFEQVGLLTFDLPDRVSSELEDAKSQIRSKAIPLKVKKNLNLKLQPTDLLMSVDEPFQHNFKAIQSPIKQNEPETDMTWHLVSEKVRASQNFISGGPVRIIFHILLNQLIQQANSAKAFQQAIGMLRYAILRERGPYVVETITRLFGCACQTISVYSLFNRPNLLNDRKQTRDQKQENSLLVRPDYRLMEMASQPIVKFVACELKIYKETLKGMLSTINLRQLRAGEENLEGKDDVGREVPSERDQRIANTNYYELEQSNKIGFTTTRGFVALQLVAEITEIISHIFDDDIRTFSLTRNLQQPVKMTQLISLLSLLHDCLAAEFYEESLLTSRDESAFERIKKFNFYPKIIEALMQFENQEPSILRPSVRFWSRFLEQPLTDLLAQNNVSTEVISPQESNLLKSQISTQKAKYFEETKEPALIKQVTQRQVPTSKLDLTLIKSEKSTVEIGELELGFELESLESPSVFSNFGDIQETNEDRQSWVESVQQPGSSKGSWSSKQKPEVSEELHVQYTTQAVNFVRKLFAALSELQETSLRSPDEIQSILLKILKQVLCKDKQRKITLAFGQATSHLFAYELLQVKINSDARLIQIRAETSKLQYQHNLSDSNERRHAVGNFFKYQENSMMQSQQIAPSITLLESRSNVQYSPDLALSKNKSTNSRVKITYMSGLSMELLGLDDFKSTIQYQHTKYLFKKIVKRLTEDESSLWFDQVEEQQQEFKEIKEVYDAIQALRAEDPSIESADTKLARVKQQLGNLDLESQNNNVVKDIERILDYARLMENPKQRCFFQSQRRTMDSWGRMLLLKPNRKALDYSAWLYYDYFVTDYLNKLFAISLLNDDNFQDLVKPVVIKSGVSESKLLKKQLSSIIEQPDQSSSESSCPDLSFEQPQEVVESTAYSVFLQKKRLELLQRQDHNQLMRKYILTDPDSLKKRNQNVDSEFVTKRSDKIKAIHKNEKDSRLFECQSVRVNGIFWGWLLLTRDYLYYLSGCCVTPSEQERPDLSFVNSEELSANLGKKELIVKWEHVDEVMKRKLVNQFQGVDLTTFHKKCYTFNLLSEQKANDFLTAVKIALSEKREESSYRIISDPRNVFIIQSSPEYQFLTEWKNGQRSNMEMLMLVNKFSGRSFNDTSQYYVFPWVLNDYQSQAHIFYERFKKNECFRDFSCHTGTITEKKKDHLIDTMEDTSSDSIQAYQYGNGGFHMKFGYSNYMLVAQWLCRLEPWSTLNLTTSDFKRDVRIAIDFHLRFHAILTEKQCMDELLPEHFYFPEVFMNLNKLSLGFQTNEDQKYQLDAMMLPPWAMNYHDFVRIMREALESKHVSKNIGSWVDLIFGVQQKSKDKFNVYFPCAYEDFWIKERLVTREEADRLKLNEEDYVTQSQKKQMLDYFIAPSKLFDKPLVFQAESALKSDTKETDIEQKTNITMLIKAFVENQKSKKKSFLGQIAVHNYLDPQTDIVHMLFNNEKKCLVFVRIEDNQDRRSETGNLVMFLCQETLSKDSFAQKPFDLQMRFEWVAEDLDNVFQIYSFPTNRLYVCGYLDNSVRIFDLEAKPGPPIRVLTNTHSARVTCIKFSLDYKYLYSCDTDGVIVHYSHASKVKESKQEVFPYRRLHKLQDQTDEILAIDCNQTLDMYVTLSRDGTISVRCQRTSKLWYNFRIFSKILKNGKEYIYSTFNRIFTKVIALKLSLHGYIVIVGQPEQASFTKYLVYNLAGDVLLCDLQEKSSVRGVFLNATEDQLIIAQNYLEKSKEPPQMQGNLRVVKLYGLEKLANLSQIVYSDARQQIQAQKQSKMDQQSSKKQLPKQISTPVIQVIAMKKSEASLNIFFTNYDHTPPTKEIICFELSKLPVWTQLADMALAPRTRAE